MTNGTELTRSQHIKREDLQEGRYVPSLLAEALKQGLMTESGAESVQLKFLQLLSVRTERYTAGESSSVRIETAQGLMESNLYTVGVALKTLPSPDDGVETLLNTDILALYAQGRKRLATKARVARQLHRSVLNTLTETGNEAYRATVVDGIRGFFKCYDPDFAAQETHITADYPLCNPVTEWVGIEFIQKYLEAVHQENLFCALFAKEDICRLLKRYDPHASFLMFNIFEQVLIAAVGCVLAGTEPLLLTMPKETVLRAQAKLLAKSRGEIGALVRNAAHWLVDELGITRGSLKHYIEDALPRIIAQIALAVDHLTLERVFLPSAETEEVAVWNIPMGVRMGNDVYRTLVEELRLCQLPAHKVVLIQAEVQSFADLEDIIFDGALIEEEVVALLTALDPATTAALMKRHPYRPEIEAADPSEAELEFRQWLHRYVCALPQEARTWVTEAAQRMRDETDL